MLRCPDAPGSLQGTRAPRMQTAHRAGVRLPITPTPGTRPSTWELQKKEKDFCDKQSSQSPHTMFRERKKCVIHKTMKPGTSTNPQQGRSRGAAMQEATGRAVPRRAQGQPGHSPPHSPPQRPQPGVHGGSAAAGLGVLLQERGGSQRGCRRLRSVGGWSKLKQPCLRSVGAGTVQAKAGLASPSGSQGRFPAWGGGGAPNSEDRPPAGEQLITRRVSSLVDSARG